MKMEAAMRMMAARQIEQLIEPNPKIWTPAYGDPL
jgi:hypothetical protein